METTKETTQPRKNDGKIRYGLLDFESLRYLSAYYVGGLADANWDLLEETIKVLEFGAKKYSVDGWKKTGYKFSDATNSLYRHVVALLRGQTHDPETGLSHYGHIMCNLMFVQYYFDHFPEHDDRAQPSIVPDLRDITNELQGVNVKETQVLSTILEYVAGFMSGNVGPEGEPSELLGTAMHLSGVGYAMQIMGAFEEDLLDRNPGLRYKPEVTTTHVHTVGCDYLLSKGLPCNCDHKSKPLVEVKEPTNKGRIHSVDCDLVKGYDFCNCKL